MGCPKKPRSIVEKLNPSRVSRAALFGDLLGKWRRPHHAADEAMPLIEIGERVLELPVLRIEGGSVPLKVPNCPGTWPPSMALLSV